MKLLSRLLVSGALLVAFTPQISPVRAAGAPDIPGAPLQSSTVQSRVGGPTVDEVYQITVAPGSVLVASLRGESGAELGIYLFDAEATNIGTGVPVAQSAKPGGSQAISIGLEYGGVFYININGRNLEREYAYTLSVSVTRDSSPPVFLEASMASRSQSTSVCAKVQGRDPTSGIDSVRIRDVLAPGSAEWVRYQGSGSYCASISAGNGPRTIDVALRNGVGLVSTPKNFVVVVDDAAPVLKSTRPGQGGIFYTPRVSIVWEFNEAIKIPSGVPSVVFAVDQRGNILLGRARVTTSGRGIRWDPAAAIAPGRTLLVGLNGVTDLAGNTMPPVDSLELYRKEAAEIVIARGSSTKRWQYFGYQISQNLIGRELAVELKNSGYWGESFVIYPNQQRGSFRIRKGGGSAVRLHWIGDEEVIETLSSRQLVGN